MNIKLLIEQHLLFLRLKGGHIGLCQNATLFDIHMSWLKCNETLVKVFRNSPESQPQHVELDRL